MAGKGDDYRKVDQKRYDRNYDAALCPKCKLRFAGEEAPCPYNEIMGGMVKTCRCCDTCRDECRRDV